MAVTITVNDVRTNPIAASFSDDVLSGFIAFVDQADACLDANSVPVAIQKNLKLYGVWSMCFNSQSGGVKSERSPNGASISYGDQTGALANPFGETLQSMDTHCCVVSLFGQSGHSFIFGAVAG